MRATASLSLSFLRMGAGWSPAGGISLGQGPGERAVCHSLSRASLQVPGLPGSDPSFSLPLRPCQLYEPQGPEVEPVTLGLPEDQT